MHAISNAFVPQEDLQSTANHPLTDRCMGSIVIKFEHAHGRLMEG